MAKQRRSLSQALSLVLAACGILAGLRTCFAAFRINRNSRSVSRVSLHGEPSERQIMFAEDLAKRFGKEAPPEIYEDMEACSQYIDEMLEESENEPSEKQLEYAESLAEKAGQKIPEEIYRSKEECSAFIDKMLEAAPASEKQIAYATRLAETNKVSEKDLEKALKSRVECSKFIDAQLETMEKEGNVLEELPPSEKQIAFATRLAETNQVKKKDLEKALKSKSACSKFIDAQLQNMEKKGTSFPPSEKQIDYATSLAQKHGIELPEDVLKDSKKISSFIDEHK